MKKASSQNPDNRTCGVSSISQAMLPLVKQVLGQKGFVEIDVLSNWDSIVGEELAQFSFPQKIDFKRGERNNGTLNLSVPTGAFAVEIQHREKFIIEKINTYFGYNAVSKLKIIQNNDISVDDIKEINQRKQHKTLVTAEEQNYINDLAEDLNNPALKEILIKLGQSVFDNNKKDEK
ncbi:MAG: DUF721 domain-containing protein [Alphaproteobacteria bacterium]|nr:DUF721 domain-containing protein [Alphaproteobacteria bacterium]